MRLFQRKLTDKQKAALNALADGIECGAALRPQGIQGLFTRIGVEGGRFEDTVKSCALGAALECHLMKTKPDYNVKDYLGIGKIDYVEILAAYGVTQRTDMKALVIDDREVGDPGDDISTLIYRLNDWLLWSRERIAQFLREAE